MGKLSSILLGTASGVAVALFLTSEKGKRVTSQAQDFIEDLKEDPEYAKEQALEKLTEVKDQTKNLCLKRKNRLNLEKSHLILSLKRQNTMLNKRLKPQRKPSIK